MAVSKSPGDFVNFLKNPGLKTNGGYVAISHYMNLNMPETCKAPELFDALSSSGIKDLDTRPPQTAYQFATQGMSQPFEEWKIMRKGQGFYECYVRLWNWIWDNQEQLQTSRDPKLKRIYDKYFAVRGVSSNPLQSMMDDGYFGYECLGFVANYLRYVELEKEYRGIENGNWKAFFDVPVNNPDDVAAVDCLEWTNSKHVALVNKVTRHDKGSPVVEIELCQSSTGGPRIDVGMLTLVADSPPAERVYMLDDTVVPLPVKGRVWVRKKRGLSYTGPT